MTFLPESWTAIFALQTPLLELVARGSSLYLGMLVFLRVVPRRITGELAMLDLVFVFLIAEAASRGLGEYTSVTDGAVIVATLMALNYLLNLLTYHAPFVERLVSAPPLEVVRDGRLLRRNMRRELLTEEELMNYLRKQGFDDLKDVKSALVEEEGNIAVIGRKHDDDQR